MSASSDPVSPFGPFAFELTPDEAHVAASLAALRRALAGGLSKRQHPYNFINVLFFHSKINEVILQRNNLVRSSAFII